MELFSQQAERMDDKDFTVCTVIDDRITVDDHVRKCSKLWAKCMAERGFREEACETATFMGEMKLGGKS